MLPLPRWLTWSGLAAVLGAAALFSALWARDEGATTVVDAVVVGIGFGSLCALGTLLAVWTALGPAAAVIRIPSALVLLGAILVIVAVLESGTSSIHDLGLFAGFILSQYFLAQLPLWIGVRAWRIGIRPPVKGSAPERIPEQFRIKHVMYFTAIVAVILGIARSLVQALTLQDARPESEVVVVVGFLVICNTTISLPLALAILLDRRWIVATVAAGTFFVLAAVEVPTFLMIRGLAVTDRIGLVIVIMNAMQCLWVSAAMGVLRLGGYRLRTASA